MQQAPGYANERHDERDHRSRQKESSGTTSKLFEIGREVFRRRVAAGRVSRQRSKANGFEAAWSNRSLKCGLVEVTTARPCQRFTKILAGEQRLTCQQIVQDSSEGEEIAALVHTLILAARLLRRHV